MDGNVLASILLTGGPFQVGDKVQITHGHCRTGTGVIHELHEPNSGDSYAIVQLDDRTRRYVHVRILNHYFGE